MTKMTIIDRRRLVKDMAILNEQGYKVMFHKPIMDDYHMFKSTSGGSGGSNGNRGGKRGWVVIVVVAILLINFIVEGASWETIENLLGWGWLAFVYFRWIST